MHNLFGDQFYREKVNMAVRRIREFAPPNEPYYLAFSGGKDSVALLRLAQMAGVSYEAVYHLTTVDPPELVWFIRRAYPECLIVRPEKTMRQLIVDNGVPPLRTIRYCCRILKEHGGDGRTVLTGVRWLESNGRKINRRIVELQTKQTVVNPIIDWSDADVWQFIRDENIPYCELYDEGFKRLGCVMCPNGGTKGMVKQLHRWPLIANMYLNACHGAYAKRALEGDEMTWRSGFDMFEWWIFNEANNKPTETTCSLFD